MMAPHWLVLQFHSIPNNQAEPYPIKLLILELSKVQLVGSYYKFLSRVEQKFNEKTTEFSYNIKKINAFGLAL